MTQDGYRSSNHDDDVSWVTIALLIILALCIAIAVTVGGWKLGWWLKGANQDNLYEVNTHSQQYQAGLVSAERDRVQGYDLAVGVPSQQKQIALTFCPVFLTMTQPPSDLVAANVRICQGGAQP